MKFANFLWKVIATHIVTYFIFGVLTFTFFDYSSLYKNSALALLMRDTADPIVALGPILQIVRGAIFAIVLWQFWGVIIAAKRSWLVLWSLLLGLAVLAPAGAAPGSLEGLIYTTIPVGVQLITLPEIILQTLCFSWFLIFWVRNPKKYIDVTMIVFIGLILFFSIAGFLAGGYKA